MEKYFEMNPIQGAPAIAAPELPREAAGTAPGVAAAPAPVDPSD
jgi:hypothetical protein